MEKNSTTYLFVYGTLRPSQPDIPAADTLYFSEIADKVVRHEPATIPNAALYNLGAYPAALQMEPNVSTADDQVHGNLLEVESSALEITDRIEGHPHFYKRQQIEVQTADGLVEAWVYWASKAIVMNKPRIENGDWFKRHTATPDTTPDSVAESPTPDQSAVDPALAGLVKRFADSECSWLATVRKDGRAHCAPMWHVWYRGRIYLVAQASSIKMENIYHNPSVTVTHPDPNNVIIIDGWAIESPAMMDAIQPLVLAKYEWDISTDENNQRVIEITPVKLMTWNNGPTQRWKSDEILNVW